ncbi:SRPBCC domain-containing protein [Candidatus Bathyarchaeota archaeon]|nr:MAG: SRPBCC domain-containing protein [Candidatus Bathyarchaeota archaeon]
MKEVSSEIVIEAPADRVWQVLTDFTKFPEWNPFIKKMSGEPRTGAKLEVRIEPPGGRAMTFKPKMVSVETNREMCWLGKLWIPGLFNGEHCFTIEALDEKGVGQCRDQSRDVLARKTLDTGIVQRRTLLYHRSLRRKGRPFRSTREVYGLACSIHGEESR